ncbi:MAG: TlyA family RNA methyltransferase [Bacteroidales bacterium]|jgi:23S rRNA (cytidine1920-2'-O)/16S rRNA (cytidine1409-2'-O)-methyltransferase|nr:TlyA family RNA methyltransferase [Bacteroidales bacterium]
MNSRLDVFLVQQGLCVSRERARVAIASGNVAVNGEVVTKPAKTIQESDEVHIADLFSRYVSLGGLKLEKAILDFHLILTGKKVLDIGASTGGFTDCALQHGAETCTCIDVGTEQMTPALKENPRVKTMEQTDFRELTTQDLDNQKYDFILADVSFISLTCLFPRFSCFLNEGGQLILLIKPQFEVGNSFLNKQGIVTYPKGYQTAILKVVTEALNHGYFLQNLTISTLFEWPKNVEFLSLFSREKCTFSLDMSSLMEEVKQKIKEVKKRKT